MKIHNMILAKENTLALFRSDERIWSMLVIAWGTWTTAEPKDESGPLVFDALQGIIPAKDATIDEFIGVRIGRYQETLNGTEWRNGEDPA